MTEHVDILIVGAGIAGVSAACHLRKRHPNKRFLILEARDGLGGTWDLFRYPGARSDSDMHTLGFGFRPWTRAETIADAPAILDYIRETAAAYDVEQRIRFGARLIAASWSSSAARWTAEIERGGGREAITASFLFMCAGYYRYDAGYTPSFEGASSFCGAIVHPQHWPTAFDCSDKRIIVIGSGATAVSLAPALAEKGARVTLLQRSPSYLFPRPRRETLDRWLGRLLPGPAARAVARWRQILFQRVSYAAARRAPGAIKKSMINDVRARLPEGFDVERHFTPRYNPWDERVCVVVDDDLFKGVASGAINIVTDEIAQFTEDGVALKSGGRFSADVIVTATGLQIEVFGGARLTVDGASVDAATTLTYRGVMAKDTPNFAFTLGYANASWTLRADLVSRFVCRVLTHMDRVGANTVTPRGAVQPTDEPFMALTSGYLRRAEGDMPRQGESAPWRHPHDYFVDLLALRFGRLNDGWLQFETAPGRSRAQGLATKGADQAA